jgi:hypothetical protein
MMRTWILVLIACCFATGALAETRSFQASLTPDIAVEAKTTQINGFSLNVWGENPQSGIALGIVNGSTGNSSGISLGLLANYAESYQGAHLAWVANYASGQFSGLQWAAFNYAGNLHGLQLGLVNYAEASGPAVQIGFINIMNQTKGWFTSFPNEVAPAMVLVNWRF